MHSVTLLHRQDAQELEIASEAEMLWNSCRFRFWYCTVTFLFQCQTSQEPGDTEKSLAEEGVYKAKVVYTQDPEQGQLEETLKSTTQSEVSVLVHSVPGQRHEQTVLQLPATLFKIAYYKYVMTKWLIRK